MLLAEQFGGLPLPVQFGDSQIGVDAAQFSGKLRPLGHQVFALHLHGIRQNVSMVGAAVDITPRWMYKINAVGVLHGLRGAFVHYASPAPD